MSFFNKPNTISYDDIKAYVDSWVVGDSEYQLYQYLYFMADAHIRKKRYGLSASSIERYAIRSSSVLFDKIYSGKKLNYEDELDKCIPEFFEDERFDIQINSDYNLFSFRNHLIDIIEKADIKSNVDSSDIRPYLQQFINHLPKKISGSQQHNLEISILLSILNTIETNRDRIFDYSESMEIQPILYHIDEKYISYIRSICQYILCNLCARLNSVLSARKETIFSIKLKELLNE